MKAVVYAPAALARFAGILEYTIEKFGEAQADAYTAQLAARTEALATGTGPRARPCELLMQGVGDASGLTCYREGSHFLILREKPERRVDEGEERHRAEDSGDCDEAGRVDDGCHHLQHHDTLPATQIDGFFFLFSPSRTFRSKRNGRTQANSIRKSQRREALQCDPKSDTLPLVTPRVSQHEPCDTRRIEAGRADDTEGAIMIKFLWVLTILGSILGALAAGSGIMLASGAPQEAAAAAVGIAFAVIPYCLARAAPEMRK